MNIDRAMQDLDALNVAVKNFRLVFEVSQGLGPDALPEKLTCSEANAFEELLVELGLDEEASSLREWHLDAEGEEEKNEAHEDWPEGMATNV